jgi:RimJ/RimL family protein N-acetyltransferase
MICPNCGAEDPRPSKSDDGTACPRCAHRFPVDETGERPDPLIHDVVTAEGLRYSVRPIRPDDADRLVAFHSHLSPRTCYLRFFSYHPVLSKTEVERFTHVDYKDRLALVAITDDRIIGVGRYDRHPGTDEAEIAFVIADEYQHHGIGSLLLDQLVDAARAQGITTFLADTLSENQAMLDVFLHSGFPVARETEYETVNLRFPIAPTRSSRQALAARDVTRRVTQSDGHNSRSL